MQPGPLEAESSDAASSSPPAPLDAGGAVAVDVLQASDTGGDKPDVAPDDPLLKLLAEKKARLEEIAAMKIRVDKEIRAVMDTGIRLNPLLVAAYAVSTPDSAALRQVPDKDGAAEQKVTHT